jgi:hypothetical protein
MRTDHYVLTWLISFKNIERQIARRIQRLQEYNFTSEHRQGENTTMPIPFLEEHVEKSVPIVTNLWRGKTSSRYELMWL